MEDPSTYVHSLTFSLNEPRGSPVEEDDNGESEKGGFNLSAFIKSGIAAQILPEVETAHLSDKMRLFVFDRLPAPSCHSARQGGRAERAALPGQSCQVTSRKSCQLSCDLLQRSRVHLRSRHYGGFNLQPVIVSRLFLPVRTFVCTYVTR